MSVIASLLVNIVGQTQKFEESVEKSKEKLTELERQSKDNEEAFEAVFGAATLKKATKLLKNQKLLLITGAALIAQAQKMAIAQQKQNLSTQQLAESINMTGEELEAVQRMTEQMALGAEEGTNAVTTMQQAFRQLEVTGGGALAEITQFGVATHDLIQLEPLERMKELDRRIESIGNEARRSEARMLAWGTAMDVVDPDTLERVEMSMKGITLQTRGVANMTREWNALWQTFENLGNLPIFQLVPIAIGQWLEVLNTFNLGLEIAYNRFGRLIDPLARLVDLIETFNRANEGTGPNPFAPTGLPAPAATERSSNMS